jgi:DNA-binding response OmpR family regulator
MGPSPNSEVRHQNQLTVKTNALALIVEDDPATRALKQIVLEADRFAVRTANNGEEWRRAIRLARERCPAVILLGLALPTASGFDVLKTFKGSADTAQISGRAYANLAGEAEVDCVVGCRAGYWIVSTPFMPACSCPGSAQK